MSREHMVILETMPEQHRESHRAARNWGRYPANGAVRMVATIADASELVDSDPDGYTEIICDADLDDERRLPLYQGQPL